MDQHTDDSLLMTNNQYDGQQDPHIAINSPNTHFKRPLEILTAINAVLSISVVALLVYTYFFLGAGPCENASKPRDKFLNIAIVLFVNFDLSILEIFCTLPILINLISQITISSLVFLFSSVIFAEGWLDSYTCGRWQGSDDGMFPRTPDCIRVKRMIMITMGVSGGVCFFICCLLLMILLLKVVALARTKFWRNYRDIFAIPSWNSTGLTAHTWNFLPKVRGKATAAIAPSAEEEARSNPIDRDLDGKPRYALYEVQYRKLRTREIFTLM